MAVGLKPLSEPEHPGWVLNAECELSPRWSYLVVQKHGQWQRLSSLLLDSFLEFCYKYDNQMVSKSSPKIRHLSFDMKTRRRFLCVEMLTCLATPTDYWILHFSLKKRGWQPRRLAICKDKGSGLTRTTHRANWFFFGSRFYYSDRPSVFHPRYLHFCTGCCHGWEITERSWDKSFIALSTPMV